MGTPNEYVIHGLVSLTSLSKPPTLVGGFCGEPGIQNQGFHRTTYSFFTTASGCCHKSLKCQPYMSVRSHPLQVLTSYNCILSSKTPKLKTKSSSTQANWHRKDQFQSQCLKHISEFKDQAPVSNAGAMPNHSGSQVKDSLLISSLFPDSTILLYFSGALHTSTTLISSESLIIAITWGGVSMRMDRIGPQRDWTFSFFPFRRSFHLSGRLSAPG
jgi:hypothetical protein